MNKPLVALLCAVAACGPLYAAPAPAAPDVGVQGVIAQAAQATAALHSLQAEVHMQSMVPGKTFVYSGSLVMERPNHVRLAFPRGKPAGFLFVSGGKSCWFMSMASMQYNKFPADAQGHDLPIGDALVSFFFDQSTAGLNVVADPDAPVVYDLGERSWQGKTYQVIELTRKKLIPNTILAYFDSDHLLRRIVTTIHLSGNEVRVDDEYLSNIRVNAPVKAALFAFVPPPGAKPYQAPQMPPAKPLLADGTPAPDFTVDDRDGKPIRLSDYRGKVVVLDFWATWCGPCQRSLPHTNAVAARFKGKNVVTLAVNVWDTQGAFDAWLPQHTDDDALTFAIDPTPGSKDVASALYHVSGIPTQYVIGPGGRIVTSLVGYGGPTDDLADAIQVALAPTK